MREYRLSKWMLVFVYIFIPLMVLVFLALMAMPLFPGMNVSLNALWLIIPFSLGMIALMVLALIDAVKGKFIIEADKIYTVGVFSNRVLMLHEINGYSVDDKYIYIESNVADKKRIKVSVYYNGQDEIKAWLASHYPDTHLLKVVQEEEEILRNEEIGFTVEQRSDRLMKARMLAKILNWTGGIIGGLALFWAQPYEYVMISCSLIPIIVIIAMKSFKGLIRINEVKGSAYPSVFIAVFASSMGLCLRALFDFDIFDYAHLWKPSLLIAILLMVALVIGNKEFTFRKWTDYLTLLGISLFVFGYGYGVVVISNCYYDQSVPQQYHAEVLNKRTTSGKTTSYYLELTPWGSRAKPEEVSVSKDLYDSIDTEDEVMIYFFKGRFDIPWFRVTQ